LSPQSGPSILPELTLKAAAAEEIHPLDDLSFVDAAMSSAAPVQPSPTGDLPLFGAPITDDVPLITRASPPRPPLAVRRSTPDTPRVRLTRPRAQRLNLMPDASDTPDLGVESSGSASISRTARAREAGWSIDDPRLTEETATVGARSVAAAIDVVILLAIDAAVVYFTMQICGIGLKELDLLPPWPLAAFLLAQNGGYLVAFTAGGQTLGKMAAGIKVVAASPRLPLDLSRAAIRELTWLVLAAPAGLGLLTTIFARDRRGLHDRFAGTRVVRASL
jgi:uncharacterized RDD family membrane protein YckC